MYNVIFSLVYILLFNNGNAHTGNGYSHSNSVHSDAAVYHTEKWMSFLPDQAKLTHLSLPGTHDAGARNGGTSAECQSLNIKEQLKSGIRVLDLRANCKDEDEQRNTFWLFHGVVGQPDKLYDVFEDMQDFLEDNPTEMIMAKIKLKEGSTFRCTTEESALFESDIYDHFDEDIYDWSEFKKLTLGQVRGKILLFWSSDSFAHAIEWDEDVDYMNTQNDWTLAVVADLYNKYTKIKNQLEDANDNGPNDDKFYINYLSGYYINPLHTASGHYATDESNGASHVSSGVTCVQGLNCGNHGFPDWPTCSCAIGICSICIQGMNIMTYDLLNDNDYEFIGIIMMDFPHFKLIKQIISTNAYRYGPMFWCWGSLGQKLDNMCFDADCTQLGGTGCSNAGTHCCTANFDENDISCSRIQYSGTGAFSVPIFPSSPCWISDPYCDFGQKNGNKCYPNDCSQMGGTGCSSAGKHCCHSHFDINDPSCTHSMAPCWIDDEYLDSNGNSFKLLNHLNVLFSVVLCLFLIVGCWICHYLLRKNKENKKNKYDVVSQSEEEEHEDLK